MTRCMRVSEYGMEMRRRKVEVGATCDRRRCNGIGGALDGSVRFWALCLRTILSLVVYILHRNGILRGCLESELESP